MKKFPSQMLQLSLAVVLLNLSVDAIGQIKTTQTIQPITASIKFTSTSVFNKSLSQKYIDATKKFMTSGSRSFLAKNTTATSKSTVELNKGGVEGSARSQTSMSSTTQDGSYSCITRNVSEKTDYFSQPLFGQTEFV